MFTGVVNRPVPKTITAGKYVWFPGQEISMVHRGNCNIDTLHCRMAKEEVFGIKIEE